LPLGSDNMKPECRGGPEAPKNLDGAPPKPGWFALTLRICLDKPASVLELRIG
jgi:hypothetical protein